MLITLDFFHTFLENKMKTHKIVVEVRLENDSDTDWIADAIFEQLQIGEDLLKFKTEEVVE